MDNEWKNQNQTSKETEKTGQSPFPADQPPVLFQSKAPVQPPAYTPPPQTSGRKKKFIIAGIGLLALILIITAVSVALNNKSKNTPDSSQSQGITIPDDWTVIDTELGFTLKTPVGWSMANKLGNDVNGVKYISTTIGNYNEAADDTEDYVTVGIQSDPRVTTKEAFEKTLKEPYQANSDTQSAQTDENQSTVTSQDANVNGESWLQVDSQIPDQTTRVLYFWVGDHVIFLGVTGSDKGKLDRLVNQFLLPMTASVELK